jgi:hypothetical protein
VPLKGISLLDLKRIAQLKGYRAGGFTLTVTQVTQVALPIILCRTVRLAVSRGFDRGRVDVADPW